jgi:hypothetical protein
MKTGTKSANINATLYDGEWQVNYDCVGVGTCRYALCSIMPPSGDEECAYREYGACRCLPAQYAALGAFKNRAARELTRIQTEMDNQ